MDALDGGGSDGGGTGRTVQEELRPELYINDDEDDVIA